MDTDKQLKELAELILKFHQETTTALTDAKTRAKAALASGIKCGEHLTQAQAIVVSGTWEAWCRNNCKPLSKSTVTRYIRLYKNRDKIKDAEGLNQAYLYLAAPEKVKTKAVKKQSKEALLQKLEELATPLSKKELETKQAEAKEMIHLFKHPHLQALLEILDELITQIEKSNADEKRELLAKMEDYVNANRTAMEGQVASV
jgi:hypothetical protein